MKVMLATPYVYGEMTSTGLARYMLIAQHAFPLEYSDKDLLLQADSDRCSEWDHAHASRCYKQHVDRHLESWFQQASAEKAIAFLVDLLKAKKEYPRAKWTGFRVLGTVHAATGYPIFSMSLFAKRDRKTAVYSGLHAPNVEGYRCRRHEWRNDGTYCEIEAY